MKRQSDGVVESWSVGSIRTTASLQYSNTPIPRRQLTFVCFTLCALLFAYCLPASAQQPKKVPRIGYLSPSDPGSESSRSESIRRALRERGYIEGQNIAIEYRYAEGKVDRFSDLAVELVRLKVDVIVTGGEGATRPAKEATSTIPIVMTQEDDPVSNGFISS